MVEIIAINTLIINASTYYHNYFMYQDSHDTGKWTMLPWDLDKTLSSYNWDNSYQQSGWWGYRTPDNPFLERALICEPIFDDIRTRIEELRDTLFNQNYINPLADSLAALIEKSVAEDITDTVESLADWHTAVENNKKNLLWNATTYFRISSTIGLIPLQ